jgi:hypothetical protein
MACEQSDTAAHSSIYASWQDDGKTFIMRKITEDGRKSSMSRPVAKPHYMLGTSEDMWLLGKKFMVQGKSWCKGIEMKSETIGFVKTRCPSIPAPEVLFSWVDPEWNQICLINKRWARR